MISTWSSFSGATRQVNTYLGGAGLDPSLREVDGRLRDNSAAALEAEDRWLEETQKSLEATAPANALAPRRIDREVALAQVKFLIHQHKVRRYQERSVDTYVTEPFRSIDFQLQGMTQTGENSYGTADEWTLVTKRVQDIPRFLKVAQEQLQAGIKSGNTPDRRMIARDGIRSAEANAKYFAEELSKLAGERIAAGPERDSLKTTLDAATKQAADAYRTFAQFMKR